MWSKRTVNAHALHGNSPMQSDVDNLVFHTTVVIQIPLKSNHLFLVTNLTPAKMSSKFVDNSFRVILPTDKSVRQNDKHTNVKT